MKIATVTFALAALASCMSASGDDYPVATPDPIAIIGEGGATLGGTGSSRGSGLDAGTGSGHDASVFGDGQIGFDTGFPP